MDRPKKILALLAALVLPLALRAQPTESFTFTTNRLVPDGNFSGLSDARTISSGIASISSLKVRLNVTGEFNGDLYAYLRHTNGFVILLNRVGKTSSNSNGYGDSGFSITFQNGAANGDIHTYQSVTVPAAGSPLTGTWQPDGRNIDPTNVTDLSTRSTSLSNFNGLSGAGAWTLFIADVASGGTNMLTQWGLDITGVAAPTLVWTNPSAITYGTPLSAAQLNATAIYNTTNVPGVFTYSPPIGTVLNSGTNQTLLVTFTPTDTNSFVAVSNSVTINVAQAGLAVSANNATKVYGAALPVLSASYSGFVNGDSTASLTTGASLSTGATSASPVGTYPIIASGAVASNYSISYNAGTLTVTPASLVVTAQNQSKVYGAALPTLTASYSGFVNGDGVGSLAPAASLSTTATASSSVGTYAITASNATNANYSISYVGGTLTITQALSSGALVSSANPSLPGTNVSFSLTVAPVAPGAGTPTGNVNFRVDGTIIGSNTLSGGVATFTTNNLTHGSHIVVAEYAGDLNFVGTTNTLSPNQIIDTPPVASNLTLPRNPLTSLKVRLSTLLGSASDPDGDSLAVTVSPTSASNAIVTIVGVWVVYTPPAGFTNSDSFTYTVTDPYGESATGTVFVTVPADNTQSQNLTITSLGNNLYQINGDGIPGTTYVIQYSDTFAPFTWQNLTGGQVLADGLGRFQTTDSSGTPTRFYRSVAH